LGGQYRNVTIQDLGPGGDIGPIINQTDAPLLFNLLDHLDRKMGGVRPTEVRLGILPGCGVMDLMGINGKPSHQVLIVGFPCLQVWTVDELSAVIAHEMAHLKLEDAVFSREVVRAADQLRRAAGHRRPLAAFVGTTIGRLAASVCREMEFRADRWASLCFRAETLAAALEKLLVIHPIFRLVTMQQDPPDGENDTIFDLFHRTWNNLPLEKFWELRSKLVFSSKPDQLDHHPSTLDRLNRLARLRTSLAPPQSASALQLLAQPDCWKRLLHKRLFLKPGTMAQTNSVFVPFEDHERTS
jgi:hypothetical protein